MFSPRDIYYKFEDEDGNEVTISFDKEYEIMHTFMKPVNGTHHYESRDVKHLEGMAITHIVREMT